MTLRSVFGVLICLCTIAACSKPAADAPATDSPAAGTPPAASAVTPEPAPAPPATITQPTFEPVYKASKAIQGATGPGVNYIKFGELLQGLSTEVSIVKDHQLNDPDRALISLYEDALAAYKFSATLWKMKIDANDDMWKGEIPVAFIGKPDIPEIMSGLEQYGLTPLDREVPYSGSKYRALPASAIQQVWLKADDILKQATEQYYGRSQ